jgi:uncharacterized protein YaeQ
MALKSTVYKATLNISDMDRNYYAEHQLTLALHPSETEERLMVRLCAFARYAAEFLKAGKGLSDAGEPDWVEADLTGQIMRWIEIGQPDDRAILKACGKSEQCVVVCYSNAAEIWWKALQTKLTRARNLTVLRLPAAQSQALAKLCNRSMQIQCSISDAQLWLSDGSETVEVTFDVLQAPNA